MIAIDRYEDVAWKALPLAERPRLLEQRLSGCGAVHPPLIPADHRAETLREFLREWSARGERPAGAFIYWGGHGESDGTHHWLLGSDSKCPAADTDGLETADLARYLRTDARRTPVADADGQQRWTVVVLDCCGAGAGAMQLAGALYSRPLVAPGVWAVLGTQGDASAYTDYFAAALVGALDTFVETDRDIPLRGLLHEIAGRLPAGAELAMRNSQADPRLLNPRYIDADVSMSLDVRDELRGLTAKLDRSPATRSIRGEGHIRLRGAERPRATDFLPQAQGAELGELAWYFTGRTEETRSIVHWLRTAPGGMLVVTGPAGVGKSALLGRVLTLSDARLVAALQRGGQVGQIAADLRAPEAILDAVVHLGGLSLADAVAQLADALLDDLAPATAAELVDALRTNRLRRTVLVDALDEARDAVAIARELLAPLAGIAGVRVLVGTRRSSSEALDRPRGREREVLDALGAGTDDTLELANDGDAVAEYARARLRRAQNSPYATRVQLADALAAAIAAHDQPFLFARLAVAELLARPLVAPGNELERLLSGGHRGLFAAACQRLAEGSAATLVLLRALAFGLGHGLPRADRVWATVAEAIAGSTRTIEASDVDSALGDAAPYIALDGEDGQSTYRLAHQTFGEHFGAGAVGDQRAHAAITTGLLEHTGAAGWSAANPYVLRHLAEHAGRGDVLDTLLGHPEALDHVDQAALANELTRAGRRR